MLRLIALASSLITVTPSMTTMTYYALNENNSQRIIDPEILREDIFKNSIYGGQVKYSEFDGQTFYSDEALNEYLLQNNKVTSVLTSSNPNKIIKNYEHMTLDETKIYDVDLNNFKQLYRDAFGNVAYSRQEALDTYVNKGHVKAQYSYDGFYWFDTPEEAKINEKYNMKINKSLYYICQNQYYNVFNDKDINALISLMDEGYYANINESLTHSPLQKPIIEKGDSKLIYDLLKKDFQKDWNGDYYNQITESETHYKLSIAPSASNRITVQYFDKNGNSMGGATDYWAGSAFTFEPRNVKYNSGQEVINGFKNAKWGEGTEGTPGFGWRYKTTTLEGYKNGQEVKIKINLVPTNWSGGGGKTPAPNLNDYSYADQSTGKIKLYSSPDKHDDQFLDVTPEKQGVYSPANITTEEKNKFYNEWYDKYFNSVITNFGVNDNRQVTYDDIKDGNYIKNVVFDGEGSKGFIYKDKAYDINYSKGYSQSLIESYLHWVEIKAKLLENPLTVEGKTVYPLRNDFLATKEQLDKFLYLEGNFQSKLMYSYSPDPDISDRQGKMLAPTLEEAKEKQIINNNKTLRKQFIAYDAFGNQEIASSSAEDAIRQLTNKIQLTSKFVHKKEIGSWDPNVKRSWDLTISDGRYNVYRIEDPNQGGKFIYYPSQDLALAAVKANAKLSSSVNTLEKAIYLYNYSATNGQVIPFVFYDNDVNSVITKIYQYEHWTTN
ncbi:hypothetical protein [Spiroplasma chrysopicola]|uniref:Uncharacterized protein n=1 Tax=Spiroplasma chrysopicola DF-1 TaxID=1276227 RepID=R4UJD6_9MOLU|nr:hypothetical protein [Spiroplasma chrysopicola]AGM25426.1 hypothetical protein SCHRY_v1c08510 [Spiroplasma chrysopicola DF-1]